MHSPRWLIDWAKSCATRPRSFAISGLRRLRAPGEILSHIGDLMDWALAQVQGRKEWRDSTPLPWEQEIARFFAALKALDAEIAARGLGAVSAEKLFQGALADALTHTGQIALLRRMAGIPVRPENYAAANIAEGRVGPDQPTPRAEFG